MGPRLLQTIWRQTPAAMKRLIPLPKPHFFWSISSRRIMTIPANTSCTRMKNSFCRLGGIGCPAEFVTLYAPPSRKASPSNMVMNTESTLLAPVKRARSPGLLKSTLIILEPDRTWSMSPAVTIGPIPSSTSVPLWLAKMTRRGPKGSLTPPVCGTP